MTAADPNQPRAPSIQWSRRHWVVAIIALACLASFACGYLTSLRSYGDRVRAEGRRQADEFLRGAVSLGIVSIDQDRLDELTADSEGGEVTDDKP